MNERILEMGLSPLTDTEYHSDPCSKPSLSSSIAKVLIDSTPLHAWLQHPRLNPDHKPTNDGKFDLGTAAHDALLRGKTEDHFVIVDEKTWQKNSAKDERAEAYLAGKTPLLTWQWRKVEAMTTAARRQLAELDRPERYELDGALVEHSFAWPERRVLSPDEILEPLPDMEQEIWCRAKLDVVRAELKFAWDYKTTKGKAHPDVIQRQLFTLGYDVQRAFYMRGLRAVLGIEVWDFELVFQETEPPYLLAPYTLVAAAECFAARRVEYALDLWARCIHRDEWPAYPQQTISVDAPRWLETQWEDREVREGRL